MRRLVFFIVGSMLCGLVMAVLYLAYAQGNSAEEQNKDEEAAGTSLQQQGPSSTETKVSTDVLQPSSARPSNGKNVQKNNGEVIELQVSSSQGTNVPAAPVAGGATNLISIALDAVPVQDVVNMFAQISGANIITAGAFTNIYVTANLKNVEWKTALSLALGSVNLALIEDPSGILMVVTSEMYKQKIQQIEETKQLVTRTFVPKYLNAVDLAEQIKLLKILSPRGTIITSQSKDQSKINIKSTGSAVEAQNIQNPSITTAIIVSDIKEYVDKVEALIAQLDRREPQVFIEARVIDVGITYDQKLGFDWGMLDKLGVSASLKDASWKFTDNRSQTMSTDNRDYQYDKRNNLDSLNRNYDVNGVEFEKVTYVDRKLADGTTISEPQVTPTRTIADTINKGRELSSDKKDNILNTFTEGKMGTMVLSATDVQLYLSALRTTGNADTLSHPVLIVGNKVEAKIHVGEQTWKISLKKDTTTIGASPVDRYSEDASPMDLGLKLWLIPEIDLPNDVVRMTIEPEMTVFVRNIVTAQGSVYPVTSTRRLSTRVTIPSTHTVVVGGLVENKKAKKEKRVPLIGDVPLLGYLFRHTEDIEERHNLLIMLTPTILDERRPLTGMEAIAQLTVNKYEQNPLAANKYVPTNQPFGQSLATNLITPSAGLMNAGQPASPALPPSVTDTSAVPPAANVQLIQQLLSNSATLNQPAPSVPPAPGN